MLAMSAKLPTWYRVWAVVVGILSIVCALIVLADPVLAVWLLVFLLAFALMFIGIDRLVAGVSGHPFWWPTMPSTPKAQKAAETTTTSPKP
ncbi:MAG TPA: DUF308 domain-containing protein [Thermoplasmata archaeon]|nr:DUF308 domain-containing protein [Thermoplasmata archaeon]